MDEIFVFIDEVIPFVNVIRPRDLYSRSGAQGEHRNQPDGMGAQRGLSSEKQPVRRIWCRH